LTLCTFQWSPASEGSFTPFDPPRECGAPAIVHWIRLSGTILDNTYACAAHWDACQRDARAWAGWEAEWRFEFIGQSSEYTMVERVERVRRNNAC